MGWNFDDSQDWYHVHCHSALDVDRIRRRTPDWNSPGVSPRTSESTVTPPCRDIAKRCVPDLRQQLASRSTIEQVR